jgi:GTP pyrophosphokinase
VYVKMRRKHLSLSQVVDMFGIRIIVGNVDECYRTLGLVHGLYRPMPGRFKDYIAIPRVNGYQSLHTSLFGPNGTPIEVQIRTEDMQRCPSRASRRTGSTRPARTAARRSRRARASG